MNTIPVDLPRLHIGDEDVPVIVGSVPSGVETDGTGRYGIFCMVKEQQFNRIGIPGIDAEIDTAVSHGCAERKAASLRAVDHGSACGYLHSDSPILIIS
jgi:hypothetical protein